MASSKNEETFSIEYYIDNVLYQTQDYKINDEINTIEPKKRKLYF